MLRDWREKVLKSVLGIREIHAVIAVEPVIVEIFRLTPILEPGYIDPYKVERLDC